MYVIMYGNDDNLYHEGPFSTWEAAKTAFEKRYEKDMSGIGEEWLDMCHPGDATYTVYVNGEYVINAEIYAIEELFGITANAWKRELKENDDVDETDKESTFGNIITGRYYLDGQPQAEGHLLCIPRKGENVLLGTELYVVQQICHNANDPHVVDIFLA